MMLREPWRTRLLFLSFAANLLLVPIAAPRLWPHHPAPTPGPPRTETMINHMVRDLPDEDAARFRATMEEHVGEIEVSRARMLSARGAMSRAIEQSPYDAAAVQASMQAWQSTWNGWSEALGQGMLAALPQLSDEGRRRLAAAGRRHTGP